jgi:hypothetical protein
VDDVVQDHLGALRVRQRHGGHEKATGAHSCEEALQERDIVCESVCTRVSARVNPVCG